MKNATYQNFGDTAEVLPKKRFVALRFWIRKESLKLKSKVEVKAAITDFKSGFCKWEQRNGAAPDGNTW